MNYETIEHMLKDKRRDLRRRENKIKERLKDYENEDKLSKHGMWSKGFWIGKLSEVDEEIYFMDSILEKIDIINSDKFINMLHSNTKLMPLSLTKEIDIELNKKCELIGES